MKTKRYQTVLELVEAAFRLHSQKPCYTCLGHTMTYQEIDQLSSRFASFLQNTLQLQAGDRLAIQLPNLLQYPVVLYGAIRAGIVVVNTNPLYTPKELVHQLKDSGAKALVVLANVAHNASAIVEQTDVEHVIVTQVGDLLPTPKRQLVNFVLKFVKKAVPPFHFKHYYHFAETVSASLPERSAIAPPSPDDLFVLQYTGGTTGVSKGAMLSHRNLCANVQQVVLNNDRLFAKDSEIIVAALPLYHIFAFNLHSLCAFLYAAHNILIPNPRDIKAFVKAVKPYKVADYVAVNTLYNALVRNPEFAKTDFSELHTSAAGGMAVTEEVARRWYELTGCPICEGYGLTETSPVLSSNPGHNIQAGTIGIPLMETEMRIVGEDGQELADGEIGELVVRGPQVMSGYWQRPEATAEVLSEDGWFHTGDIAIKRPDGYFKIVDRKKDMILVSGFNVYPNEIEDVVSAHQAVLECAAIGIPSVETGEAVKLFVVANGARPTKEDIISHCRQSLTAYKVPKLIEFVDALPKTNVGKILRRELREPAPPEKQVAQRQ